MNRLLKKLLITGIVLSIVVVAGYFTRKAFKRSRVQSLVSQADNYLAEKDWRNAQLCLQRALELIPGNLDATRAMAELLEDVGAPNAVDWRAKAAELQPDNAALRLDWAATAIKVGDLKSATNALAEVPESARGSAGYWSLMGALAWSHHDVTSAGESYDKAVRLEPTNLVSRANLATIRLLSTNPVTVAGAKVDLLSLSTNAAVRLVALRHLRDFAVTKGNTNDAVRFATEIAKDPAASLSDNLDQLSILKVARDPGFSSVLERLKKEGTKSSLVAFTVGRWIAQNESPTNAFDWLKRLPLDVQTNQPVPLLVSDCLIAQRNWIHLEELAQLGDWQASEFYRFAVLSLAQRLQGKDVAAKASWQRALREGNGNLSRLTRLSQVCTAWNWTSEKEEVLSNLIATYPKATWALNSLVLIYYAEGKTREIEKVLFASYNENKDDPHLQNNLANVLLLLKSRLELAHALARQAYEALPNDPFFISTYAYSLYLQDKVTEARKVIETIEPEALRNPAIATYCALIQSSSSDKEKAREAVAFADNAKMMLPEERELVRQAKTAL